MNIIVISGEKGVGYSSKISTIVMQVVLAMTAIWLHNLHYSKLQPDSNVLRIQYILHVMKGSHTSMMIQSQ